jgi:hypothetical protein
MTLTKYIKELQKLEAAGYGGLEVVYAPDPTKSEKKPVIYGPCVSFDFKSPQETDKICLN